MSNGRQLPKRVWLEIDRVTDPEFYRALEEKPREVPPPDWTKVRRILSAANVEGVVVPPTTEEERRDLCLKLRKLRDQVRKVWGKSDPRVIELEVTLERVAQYKP